MNGHLFSTIARSSIWKARTALGKKLLILQHRCGLDRYDWWIRKFEPPLITYSYPEMSRSEFILAIYCPSPNEDSLKKTIDSILVQTYPYWRLEILIPGHVPPMNPTILDERIRVNCTDHDELIHLDGDQGKSFFLIWLEPGDTLSANALGEVAFAINTHINCDMIYTDEDRFRPGSSTRFSPFFKPDWSPELLLSTHYLLHAAIRIHGGIPYKTLIDPYTYGVWVLSRIATARGIVHIPKVLYHIAFENNHRVLQANWTNDLLRQNGRVGIAVDDRANGQIRVRWSTSQPMVSIIIPSRDKVDYLRRCLTSILKETSYPNYEILILDDHSRNVETLNYYHELEKSPHVRIIPAQGDFNWSAVNNQGARQAKGDLFLFLNNDIEVIDPTWLEELVMWAEMPGVGVVGSKLLYPDGTIQHAGVIMGMEGHASHVFSRMKEGANGPFGSVEWYRDYSAVTGACMLVPRKVFEHLKGFDDNFLLVFSDIELCLRVIKAGYRVVYNPFARLIHYEGKSRAQYMPRIDIQKGYEQFKDYIANGDPYYNPNLSYSVREPMLCQPNEETQRERLEHIVNHL